MADLEPLAPDALAAEIVDRLAALPSRATAAVRDLRREYSLRLAKTAPATVPAVARRLLEGPDFATRFVAYEWIDQRTIKSLPDPDAYGVGFCFPHTWVLVTGRRVLR